MNVASAVSFVWDTKLAFPSVQLYHGLQICKKIVTLSTIEAEYVAAIKAGKEMIWLHGFLDELGKKQAMGILHSNN